jgi:hypothetical protein
MGRLDSHVVGAGRLIFATVVAHGMVIDRELYGPVPRVPVYMPPTQGIRFHCVNNGRYCKIKGIRARFGQWRIRMGVSFPRVAAGAGENIPTVP